MDCLTLKKSNCKNCYKCLRHCPVKAIRFSGNQAYIIGNECILCGRCFVVCPQDAKQIVSEKEKVRVLLQAGEQVIVSLAPSFVANYEGVGIDAMRDALMKLGFSGAEETAVGATIVKKEYEKMVNSGTRDVIISTCCHSVNLLVQKHFPALVGLLANVLSPMQAHAADIKKRFPGAKVVFIGPCVAKKDEAAQYDGFVDAVLTFDELSEMFGEAKIELKKIENHDENTRARFFPTTGGILKTMDKKEDCGYTFMAVDTAENCIAALKDIENGGLHKCFIEMSICPGSCVGGPVMEKFHRSPVRDYASVSSVAGKKDFAVDELAESEVSKSFEIIEHKSSMPSESEITEILHRMGKTKPSDELNCGSCGYDTCREKAAAIYQGKASVTMCLPYLKEKAESFSDTIVRNTPNGLIVLNENLEVQQINKAAQKILNIRLASDILGGQIIRVYDPCDFLDVLTSHQDIKNKRVFLAEYEKYVEESIIYDKEYHLLFCILRDITEEETQRKSKESISRQTVEVADKVVDKQMRIVQEIASLLGETAAETKIALSKLKESITCE